MTDPTLFTIPQTLLEKVLTYLAARPYLEVAALIAELTQCQPVSASPLPKEYDGPGYP